MDFRDSASLSGFPKAELDFRARGSRATESVSPPASCEGRKILPRILAEFKKFPPGGGASATEGEKGEEKIGRSGAKPEAAHLTRLSPGYRLRAPVGPNIQDGEAGNGPAQQQPHLARNQVPRRRPPSRASWSCALHASQPSPRPVSSLAWLSWQRINPPSPMLSQTNPEKLSQG